MVLAVTESRGKTPFTNPQALNDLPYIEVFIKHRWSNSNLTGRLCLLTPSPRWAPPLQRSALLSRQPQPQNTHGKYCVARRGPELKGGGAERGQRVQLEPEHGRRRRHERRQPFLLLLLRPFLSLSAFWIFQPIFKSNFRVAKREERESVEAMTRAKGKSLDEVIWTWIIP